MSLHRTLWLVLPSAVTLLVACKDSGGETSGPVGTASAPIVEAPQPAPATPSPEQARLNPRSRRLPAMMFQAAKELDLKDAQRTSVATLEQQLQHDTAGLRTEFNDYHSALAAQLRAGAIDAAKLEPRAAAIEKAIEQSRTKEAEGLNGIHAVLDLGQRKALVGSVRARIAERATANEPREAASVTNNDRAKRELDHLVKELDLDASQQTSVQALLAKRDREAAGAMDALRAEQQKRTAAILTAFEGEGFDARKLDAVSMSAKNVREHMERHVQFVSQLVPILRPEQREKLAVETAKPIAAQDEYAPTYVAPFMDQPRDPPAKP
jgi:Spy/CpxP family protein refolding chaperone